MVICVGGVGAGKTLLLSALCQPASFSPDSAIVPTVGVNIFTLHTRHRKSVNIRELGGALSPVWSTYLSQESCLIFVIDSSDLSSSGLVASKLCDCIALLETNAVRDNKVGRLCLVWSKLDRSYTHIQTIRSILCLQQVVHHSSLVVTEILWDLEKRTGLTQLEAWVTSVGANSE